MGKTLGQILMDEARQTGLQEWMKKVQVAVRQTDVKNPVTWTALERLSRDVEGTLPLPFIKNTGRTGLPDIGCLS